MSRINEFTDLATIAEVMEIGDTLKGKSICVSGHLGRPRQDIKKLIEMAGGEFNDTLTGFTTHLLTNADWTKGSTVGKVSSKYAKAARYGVKIINEKQFYDILCSSSA